jgi:endo-1,4-beta-D-glucanase Y
MRSVDCLRALALLAAITACGGDGDERPGGLGHPFGSHAGYAAGAIRPSADPDALDAATAAFYDEWKTRFLEPACGDGELRIRFASAGAKRTVSEAIGYGMLATVVMAGHDPEARALFDGLWRYVEEHPSAENADLMAWAQNRDCEDVEGSDSASDGDLDIAYALLLADVQWGSAGDIDYRAAADRRIAAVLASDVHPEADSILLGSWALDPEYADGTRLSDQMPSHFKAFAATSGDAHWDAVTDRSYATLAALQADHAPATGLVPDFAVGADGDSPAPAPARYLEGPGDGRYDYNACRVPWRIASDVLVSGDARGRDAMRALNAWVRDSTGDDPSAIRAGYALDGSPTADYETMAFVAPFAVSAMIEPASGSNQAWLDALWEEIAASAPEDYYEDSIKLLSMIAVSGNWWSPVE